MSQANKKFDNDLKFGQAGEALITHLADERKLEVKRDRLWRKTGNIFIETACNGKPSGVMATESDYLFYLLDDDGKVVSGLLLDAPKLVGALTKLFNDGSIRKLSAGDGKRSEGFLVPLAVLPTMLQLMAGVNIAAPRPSDNKTPIVITTDGSFRDGGHGGGHAILERNGSADKRDDFHRTITWQGHAKDSYEAELLSVLEALKYLQEGRKRCILTFQCDNVSVVDRINAMGAQMQRNGHISDIPPETPCAAVWHEIAERIQIHAFGAVHYRYAPNKPESVECHNAAYNASGEWRAKINQNNQNGRNR